MLDMEAYVYNPKTWEVEAGRFFFNSEQARPTEQDWVFINQKGEKEKRMEEWREGKGRREKLEEEGSSKKKIDCISICLSIYL